MILQHLILEPRALLLHMTYAPRSQESTAGLWDRKWKFQVFLSTVRCFRWYASFVVVVLVVVVVADIVRSPATRAGRQKISL